MYKEKDEKQVELEDFYLPFGGKLNRETPWVLLSEKIPREHIEKG